jgi:hypothetical protein
MEPGKDRKCWVKVTEGEKIVFGVGPEGLRLNKPNPKLCRLHLAIARAMQSSGVNKAREEAIRKNIETSAIFQELPSVGVFDDNVEGITTGTNEEKQKEEEEEEEEEEKWWFRSDED